MNWAILVIIVYVLALAVVGIHILVTTKQSNKTLAYLLFVVFVPLAGILFYITFGINYWTKKRYGRKFLQNSLVMQQLRMSVAHYEGSAVSGLEENSELASMLLRDLGSPLTGNNRIRLLSNGEEKFPALFEAIREARHHIHMEYYIYEYDEIGTQIIDLLIRKAADGVEVRLIYDDFGSPSINRKTEQVLRKAGVEVYPFHKIRFYLLANRFNYRNHRKIVIVDGKTAFTGGINVSDKYINNGKKRLYWRDSHIRIDGPGVYYLQYIFISDWQFCSGNTIEPGEQYFPSIQGIPGGSYMQVAASGPDSLFPSVQYTLLQAIYLARKEILITSPYFIPGDSIMDALQIAAISGLQVKLLVPGVSDSGFVNAAARSNYGKLLEAGVEIYRYQKGFIHAKTMVTDSRLCIIGTANMDYRSFELNFEVNAVIYDRDCASVFRDSFMKDLADAEKIDKLNWLSRRWYHLLPERIARLFSPVM